MTGEGSGPLGMPGPVAGIDPSFIDLLRRTRPEATLPPPAAGLPEVAHGTTVLGLRFRGGVVVAGDRRATEGYAIADDDMEKVFEADDYSAIAIAGAAGQAIEVVRLFQLELEHYEKITGDRLSLEGKANRLAQMIRGNLPLAMQGLAVVPLFGGYDERRDEGRIFRYDVTGGRWEDDDYHATGSGGRPAKASLKKRWHPDLDEAGAVRVAVEALLDASEEDAATGGIDPRRNIFPTVLVITAGGAREIPQDDVRVAYEAVVGERGDR
jgi:proteasome beta subunit